MNALTTLFPFLHRRRNYKDAINSTYIHVNSPQLHPHTYEYIEYVGMSTFTQQLKSIPVQSEEERRVLNTIAKLYMELHLHGYAGVILTTTRTTYVLLNCSYPARHVLPVYAAFATVDILTAAAVAAAVTH